MTSLTFVCFFTFLIHMTESVVYSFRLAGIRTRQLAIALSFVTSALLVSRLSNLFQAPLLGAMVDQSILVNTPAALSQLAADFRLIILAAFFGSLMGCIVTPTACRVFQRAILSFLVHGSLPKVVWRACQPKTIIRGMRSIRWPTGRYRSLFTLGTLPKGFLILNIVVTATYTIGVLCALYAGALLPDFRATAIQLSGLINGMATIFLTLFVDPAGARITDQAFHGTRPESDVRTTVFFLLMGRLVGTLIIAQLLFIPFSVYLTKVTLWLSHYLVL